MLGTQQYQYKDFKIEAIRLTLENVKSVGVWCNEIVTVWLDASDKPHTAYLIFDTDDYRAMGDWVYKIGDEFKCCSHEEFRKLFEKVNQMRFAQIRKFVSEAMAAQLVAQHFGDQQLVENVADAVAKKIFELR